MMSEDQFSQSFKVKLGLKVPGVLGGRNRRFKATKTELKALCVTKNEEVIKKLLHRMEDGDFVFIADNSLNKS